MIQLILTDFDGTLFPKSGGELTPPFVQKVKNLTDRGCLFAVNSGRPYSVLKDMLRPIQNRTVFICNDGTQIMYKNCLLYKNPVATDAAAGLYSAAAERGLTPFAALRERTLPVSTDVLHTKGLFGEEIYKLVLIKNDATETALAILRRLAVDRGLRVCFEDDLYLEFCNGSADKGVATAFLKQKFGITSQIAAFGDTAADFAMFDEADQVYLMRQSGGICYPGASVIDSMQDYVVQNF